MVIMYVAWTMGFGVFLMTRFGTRYRWSNGDSPAEPASAAPVAPEPPFEPTPPALPEGDPES